MAAPSLSFLSSYHLWTFNKKSKVYGDKVQHIHNLPSLPSPCWHVAGCTENKINLFNCSGGLSKVCRVASAVWLLKKVGEMVCAGNPSNQVKNQTFGKSALGRIHEYTTEWSTDMPSSFQIHNIKYCNKKLSISLLCTNNLKDGRESKDNE